MSPDQLAIHTFTNKPWSIHECLENYARRGIGGISIWRETVAGQDLAKVRKHLDDSGLKPVSLVRGGFFTGKDLPTREAAIESNREALREAEALGLPMIVLVCGATIGQTPEENLEQIRDGIAALLPQAESAGIRLAIEPLHPMYAGDRSAVASMRDANELAESLDHPLVGVALDVFHVWWESGLEAQIRRCATADRLFAFHVCEFKPDFDHVLLDRGLPGEGVNASARIAKMVQAAGFDGLTEVEIFSRKYWSENQHDFLEKIVRSCEALQDNGPLRFKTTDRRLENFAFCSTSSLPSVVFPSSVSAFMKTKKLGIILNGVTGRMGTNQHLVRSILAIRDQGGVMCGDTLVIPDPILTGRNEDKIRSLAAKHGVERFTTDLDAALPDPHNEIFFDASGTPYRIGFLEKAIAAGKHVYCEKPTAVSFDEALRIAEVAEKAGVKNGAVQDKLWLPGLRKFQLLKEQGFFGKILSVRGEFGYWVFTGEHQGQPIQRPSWNYRSEDGGGMIVDMHCHWRYVIDNLFGNVTRVFCKAATHIERRFDESGKPFKCTADDSAYALFETDTGIVCQFNSSWNVRVRRDDLLTMQVDGTEGSAIVGLRKCWAQHQSVTPRPVWNPDIDSPINYYDNWTEVPDQLSFDNAFKIQWELFLKHVVNDEPFRWTLREGAKGVQLAELSWKSHEAGAWVDVPALG